MIRLSLAILLSFLSGSSARGELFDLFKNGQRKCNAFSVVGRNVLVTAAHCVAETGAYSVERASTSLSFPVVKVCLHPQFNSSYVFEQEFLKSFDIFDIATLVVYGRDQRDSATFELSDEIPSNGKEYFLLTNSKKILDSFGKRDVSVTFIRTENNYYHFDVQGILN